MATKTIKKDSQPEAADVVEIGAIVPLLVNLTDMSNQLVLDGFKLAFQNRQVDAPNGKRYIITQVFYSTAHPSKILARLQKIDPEEQKLEARSA